MNHCVLTGNLGDDPKDFYTPDGVAISSFQMAFRSGKDKTSWIRVRLLQQTGRSRYPLPS